MFDISNKRLHGFITREFDKLTVEDRQDKSKEVLTFIKVRSASLYIFKWWVSQNDKTNLPRTKNAKKSFL